MHVHLSRSTHLLTQSTRMHPIPSPHPRTPPKPTKATSTATRRARCTLSLKRTANISTKQAVPATFFLPIFCLFLLPYFSFSPKLERATPAASARRAKPNKKERRCAAWKRDGKAKRESRKRGFGKNGRRGRRGSQNAGPKEQEPALPSLTGGQAGERTCARVEEEESLMEFACSAKSSPLSFHFFFTCFFTLTPPPLSFFAFLSAGVPRASTSSASSSS